MMSRIVRRARSGRPPRIEGRYGQIRAFGCDCGMALHALTWGEAWTAYEPKVPAAELARRASELALDYHFFCCVIEDRIAFLAKHAGRPFPE